MLIEQDEFERNLYTYYKHLFPIEMIVDWLSYSKDNSKEAKYFLRREFSFERSIDNGETVYQRYQAFPNALSLQKFLLSSNDNTSSLIKYDIGAVFDKIPKKGEKMKALEKEVVVDIDMDAYDEVRSCCQGAKICEKCWEFLQVACEILRPALQDDFGFEHILAVYSGRRGIHLWICDYDVRTSENDVRAALINYLNINVGNAEAAEIIKGTNQPAIKYLHPSIQRAHRIAKKAFTKIILENQNGLVKENVKKKISTILKRKDLFNNDFANRIQTLNDSKEIWAMINSIKAPQEEKLELAKLEIILMCLYPRLDANVSTTINHLLKGPFSIHPKTQRVCVPFNLNESSNFNPLEAPTLPNILNELQALPQEIKVKKNEQDLYPFLAKNIGSLANFIKLFEDFINKYNKITIK